MHVLPQIKINRSFTPKSFHGTKSAQLHHFFDAGTFRYGVASYLRLQYTEDNIHCSLLMGKSRVVPKGAPSIPQLKLTAATVAAKIGYLLFKELPFRDVKEVYWTDSRVVLSYLNNEPKAISHVCCKPSEDNLRLY